MKKPSPLSLGHLAGAGMTVVGTVVVGMLLGIAAARLWHWEWAVPVGILAGFAAGFVSMFRQLQSIMR